MNKQIWKFEIDSPSKLGIEMPIGAEILTVQVQNETPCIWALVNPEETKMKRYFEIYGTGMGIYCDMGIDRKYIGTFQLNSGALVFHVFEREYF